MVNLGSPDSTNLKEVVKKSWRILYGWACNTRSLCNGGFTRKRL